MFHFQACGAGGRRLLCGLLLKGLQLGERPDTAQFLGLVDGFRRRLLAAGRLGLGGRRFLDLLVLGARGACARLALLGHDLARLGARCCCGRLRGRVRLAVLARLRLLLGLGLLALLAFAALLLACARPGGRSAVFLAAAQSRGGRGIVRWPFEVAEAPGSGLVLVVLLDVLRHGRKELGLIFGVLEQNGRPHGVKANGYGKDN